MRGRHRRAWLVAVVLGVAAEIGLRLAGAHYLRQFDDAAAGSGDAVRIVCLGESSTAGLWLERPDSYPGQLESALRRAYASDRIRVVVPPHVGQNTSQMAHRIDAYLDRYQPRLVIVMAGYNNEWSLAESDIGRFLGATDERWRAQLLVRLESLRLFRVLRWMWLRLSRAADDLTRSPGYVWGAPELVRYPPSGEVYAFAAANRPAFVALWRHDVGRIVARARARGASALLMTYHINPSYLPAEEFESFARELDMPLVRNDVGFAHAIQEENAADLLFHDDWHPNRKGYAVIARGAFEAILGRDLLRLGAPRSASWSGETDPLSVPAAGIAMGQVDAEEWLGRGWSRPESGFRWTDGPRAELVFAKPEWGAAVLSLRARPFLVPRRLTAQRVGVAVNGKPVARWVLAQPEPQTLRLELDGTALGEQNRLELTFENAASPRALGAGDDDRRLALAVERVFLGPPLLPVRGIPASELDAYVGDGWGADEGGFRWTVSRSAEIRFRTEAHGPRHIQLRLSPYLAEGALERQRVTWTLDGLAPRTEELRRSEPSLLDVPVPMGATSHRLTLQLPDAVAASTFGGDDVRLLGVALHGLVGRP